MTRCECFVERPDINVKAGARCLNEARGKYRVVDIGNEVDLCSQCVLDALDRGRTVKKVGLTGG